MELWDLMSAYLRLGFHNIRISTSVFKLSFGISKCPTYGKPSGQYSDWSNDEFRLLKFIDTFLDRLVWQRLGSCCLVNLTTCFDNAIILVNIWGLMITTQSNHLLTTIRRQNSSTISNISSVTNLADYQHNYCAWTWSLNYCHLSGFFVLWLADL